MIRVAVIGSGVVGAAIAYELSKLNKYQITLLDQHQPASGATGAALGIMMGVISHKFKGRAWQLRHTSLQRYESLIPELEAITGLSIPYHRQGILKLTNNQQELAKWQELVKIRQEQGLRLEIWDQERINTLCPQIDIDKNQILASLYSPDDRQVNPSILTQALVTAANQQGVNCLFGVKVENLISNSPSHCGLIETNRGNLEVDWVIIAAGIGSTPLIKSLSIRPVLGQAIQIKLPQNLTATDFEPIITGDDVHIVPLGKGEYWLGATVEFESEDQEITPDLTQLDIVTQKAIAFCPALATGEIVNSWFGLRPRPDHRPAPIIENLTGYNNVILATGHYRNGVMLAPATAMAIVEMLNSSN